MDQRARTFMLAVNAPPAAGALLGYQAVPACKPRVRPIWMRETQEDHDLQTESITLALETLWLALYAGMCAKDVLACELPWANLLMWHAQRTLSLGLPLCSCERGGTR